MICTKVEPYYTNINADERTPIKSGVSIAEDDMWGLKFFGGDNDESSFEYIVDNAGFVSLDSWNLLAKSDHILELYCESGLGSIESDQKHFTFRAEPEIGDDSGMISQFLKIRASSVRPLLIDALAKVKAWMGPR